MPEIAGDRRLTEMAPEAERALYATTEYARAFGGPVLDLPEWHTAVLRRPIPSSEWDDALGCYPLCVIPPEADLEGGLDRLRAAGLVSVALVTDPVSSPSAAALRAAFSVCRPFKTHYLIEPPVAGQARYPATHRRWIRKALRECQVTPVRLADSLGDWERLYCMTVDRHRITGLQKFSPEYFAALATMPKVEAFAARTGGEIVAMALWVRSGEVAYYHLGASDSRGFERQSMYGIFATAIEHFATLKVLHLGGAAGIAPNEDGLARFKRGFATREVEAYFCGARLHPKRYETLAGGRTESTFFPAYREP